jgi:hypothetical protein
MRRYISLLLFIGLAFWSCDGTKSHTHGYTTTIDTLYYSNFDTVYVAGDTIYVFTVDTVYLIPEELPPYPPTQFSATLEGDSITLSWQESMSQDIDSYAIYRNDSYIAFTNLQTHIFIDTDLNYSTTYCYRIYAIDSTGLLSDPTPDACRTTSNDPDLFDVKLYHDGASSHGVTCAIYHNTTDNSIFVWGPYQGDNVFIEEDLLSAGNQYLVKAWYYNSGGTYTSTPLAFFQVSSDVQITIQGNSTPIIEEWNP